MGESKDCVWEVLSKFTPQLNFLQQKDETLSSATSLDPEVISNMFWKKVAENLLELAAKMSSNKEVMKSFKKLHVHYL